MIFILTFFRWKIFFFLTVSSIYGCCFWILYIGFCITKAYVTVYFFIIFILRKDIHNSTSVFNRFIWCVLRIDCTATIICPVVDQSVNSVPIIVSSKIIRALAIIHVKNSYLMKFYEINIYQITIFRLYTFYNKHDNDKNWLAN